MLDFTQEELEQLEKDLQEEQTNLKQQQQQQERTSSTVTGQMCQESQVSTLGTRNQQFHVNATQIIHVDST